MLDFLGERDAHDAIVEAIEACSRKARSSRPTSAHGRHRRRDEACWRGCRDGTRIGPLDVLKANIRRE